MYKPIVAIDVAAENATVEPKLGSDRTNARKAASQIVLTGLWNFLSTLLKNQTTGNIVIGGKTDGKDCYIAPTVITDVGFNDPCLMSDEIFGPILPIITYNILEEAVALISRK